MKVGIIGLGKMGAGMARNLAKDHEVVAYDAFPAAAEAINDVPLRVAESAETLASEVDVVVTMLPGPSEILSLMGGAGGLAHRLRPGALWIDMSSSSHEAMRTVLASTDSPRFGAIDAPVTGGVPGATNGTLQIFVGATDEQFAQALPVLRSMGNPERILHVGPQGSGYTVKLCINLGFFLHALAGAEVMALGTKAGVDQDQLHEALTGSGATSAFLERDFVENVAKSDYKEYFRLALALKDIALAVDLGRDVGLPMEVSALVEQLHRRALGRYGDGGQLLAIKQLEDDAGVSFNPSAR